MAWTAPSTWVAGAILTAAQLNEQLRDNMSVLAPFAAAWTSWTPTLTQSGAVTKTVTSATYVQVGKLVIAQFNLSVTGAGTAGVGVLMGLPVTALGFLKSVGTCAIFDTSASTTYGGTCTSLSTTTVGFVGDWSGANTWGSQPSLALANGDVIRGTLMFEAA